jgi:hypothetical protein
VSKLCLVRFDNNHYSVNASPHFSKYEVHRGCESAISCFTRTAYADAERFPDADGV